MLLLLNKMGFRGKAPKFYTYSYIFNFEECLLNHYRNIVIVLLSQKFGGGNIDW